MRYPRPLIKSVFLWKIVPMGRANATVSHDTENRSSYKICVFEGILIVAAAKNASTLAGWLPDTFCDRKMLWRWPVLHTLKEKTTNETAARPTIWTRLSLPEAALKKYTGRLRRRHCCCVSYRFATCNSDLNSSLRFYFEKELKISMDHSRLYNRQPNYQLLIWQATKNNKQVLEMRLRSIP